MAPFLWIQQGCTEWIELETFQNKTFSHQLVELFLSNIGTNIERAITHHVRRAEKKVQMDFAPKDKDAAPLNFTLLPSTIVKKQQGLITPSTKLEPERIHN